MRCVVVVFILASATKGYQRPQPRLVYPRLLEERSSNGRMVMHVHDDLTLNLRKASVAAPKLRVVTEEDGVSATRFYNGAEIEKDLYEDEEKIATLHVTRSANGVQMNGLVGPHHRISPMPTLERSAGDGVPHLIHEIEQEEMMDKHLSGDKKDPRELLKERQYGRSHRWPDTVRVEVFIVADLRHYSYFTKTEDLLAYLCVIANGANLRLFETKDPGINLMLTGLALSNNDKFDELSDNDLLFDEGAIKGFKEYAWKKRNEFGGPDVVYLISGRDVFTIHEGKFTNRGLGIGYLSGVCSHSFVALGEDKPGFFTGLHTFTHEVAHTLGATHDGQDPDNQGPGYPSAVGCSWDDGNIMSYIKNGASQYYFSKCSLAQMQYLIRTKGESCWAVSGKEQRWEGVYAGMTVPFQRFCANVLTGKENVTFEFVNKTTCKVRCRFVKHVAYQYRGETFYYEDAYYTEAQALDYMACDVNMACVRGKCVPFRRNHNVPPVAPPEPSPEHTTTTSTTTWSNPVSTAEPSSETTSGCHCDCSSQASTTASRAPTTPRRKRYNFLDRIRTRGN
ncbi:venom metalloproteinase antarease TserMP_A-like [Haemaphysalis longicornis]